MNQGLTTVQEFLKVSGTSLYTLTAGRIAKRKLPKNFKNEEAIIVINPPVEDTSEPTGSVMRGRYTFLCYGGTNSGEDAWDVFEALMSRLQGITGNATSGGLVLAELETKSETSDPDEGWPLVVAIFRIQTA